MMCFTVLFKTSFVNARAYHGFDLMFPHKVWGGGVVIFVSFVRQVARLCWRCPLDSSGVPRHLFQVFQLPARSECQAILARLSSGELLADSVRVARLC